MMSANHVLAGATVYTWAPAVGLEAGWEGSAWAVMFALSADICSPTSTISQWLDPFDNLIRTVTGIKHRGLTHRWWFVAPVTALLHWKAPFLAVPFGTGWGSHIAADGIYKTNGWFEWWVCRPLLMVAFGAGLVLVRWHDWRVFA